MASPHHIAIHRWRRLYTPLEIVLATVCYFHEAQVVAKNSSKQLICLLDDIVPFYLDFTVYATLCLTAPIFVRQRHGHGGPCRKCEFVDRFGQLNTRLGNIVQQRNFAYITQPISRSQTVRGIFPFPVANGIEIKRKTRHAARTASTCFGTSTTLFERWRHIYAHRDVHAMLKPSPF